MAWRSTVTSWYPTKTVAHKATIARWNAAHKRAGMGKSSAAMLVLSLHSRMDGMLSVRSGARNNGLPVLVARTRA